jgi:hypothetical protein
VSDQIIGIVLRVASDRTSEFEAMFAAEEIPIWDNFAARGLFRDAWLVKVQDGSEVQAGVQDYLLHIVARGMGAHDAHDGDPRFKAFLGKALEMQPKQPLVWFGEAVFERHAARP